MTWVLIIALISQYGTSMTTAEYGDRPGLHGYCQKLSSLSCTPKSSWYLLHHMLCSGCAADYVG